MLKYFKPPILSNEERTLNARLLHIILWISMLAVTLIVVFYILLEPMNSLRWLLTIALGDSVGLAMVGLNRRGYTRLASIGLITTLWLVFTSLAITAGSLREPAMMAYFGVVPLAVLLLDGKSAIIVGIGYALTGLGLLAASEAGFLMPEAANVTPTLLLAAFLLIMAVIVAAQYVSTKIIKDALGRAHHEIVERKNAEAALLQSEAKLRTYIDVAPVAMIWYDPDGKVEFANRKSLELFGYTIEEIWTPDQWFHRAYPDPAYHEKVISGWQAAVSEAQRTGKEVPPFETTVTCKDGSTRFVEISGAVVDGRILIAFNDLTGRKQAEEELRESEQRYREVFDYTSSGIFLIDVTPDNRFITMAFNPADKEMTGLSEDLYGKSTDDGLSPEVARAVNVKYLSCVETGETICYEERLALPVGIKDFNTTLIPVRDPTGRIYRIVGIANDITGNKKAEVEHRDRLAQAELLASVSRALADVSLDYEAALDVITQEVTHEIGDTCAVFLVSEDGGHLTPATIHHSDARAEQFSRNLAVLGSFDLGSGLVGRVAQTGQPSVINEGYSDQIQSMLRPEMADYQERLGIGSVMAVPMRAQGSTIGVLGLIRHQAGKPYSAEDQALVQELADRAALTITNARLYAENIRQAGLLRQANEELEQRIAERTAELADLYNNAPCGYQSLDEDGRFVRINETGLKMYGYSREELIGKKLFEINSPAFQEKFMTNFIQVKELGAISNAESEVIRKDGSVLPVLVSAMAEKDASGRFSRSRATVIDNTERKEAEAQIYKLNAELAARAQKLEMINKELESFSYTVSHDLKTPLRGINGYSHLLLEDYADRIDEEGRFFLQNIRKASSQMGRLIDDLLTYSRLERRPLNPTAVELQLFVDGLLAQYADEAQARHVALTVSLPNTILQVDPDGLGVALRNVIDNAFKYTQHVISPAVEIGGEETDHTCLVWVKDNGIGFDMRYHDRIFEIFQRLGQDEDYPGTGVGLALVRKAIQRMGGKVWADSKPGEGAIFFLEIPK